jgi:hypothetical protein
MGIQELSPDTNEWDTTTLGRIPQERIKKQIKKNIE